MGWEQLQPAIQNAFDTYWGRKESQADRAHQLEALQMQLQHTTDENEKQRLQDRINAMLEREHEEEMKKIPSTVIQKFEGTGQGEGEKFHLNAMLKELGQKVDMVTRDFMDLGPREFEEFNRRNPGLMEEDTYMALKATKASTKVAKQAITSRIAARYLMENESTALGHGMDLADEMAEYLDDIDIEQLMADYEKLTAQAGTSGGASGGWFSSPTQPKKMDLGNIQRVPGTLTPKEEEGLLRGH